MNSGCNGATAPIVDFYTVSVCLLQAACICLPGLSLTHSVCGLCVVEYVICTLEHLFYGETCSFLALLFWS